MILNISSFFKRWIPRRCMLCGGVSSNQPLCAACLADLPHYSRPHCPKCAIPTPDGQICGTCLQHPPAQVRTLAAFSYAFPVDQLIQALKYQQRLAIAPILGQALALAAHSRPRPELLIPMPLHPTRLKQRGFNHATEIAREVAARLNVPLSLSTCERVRDTPPQVALAYDQRRRNVRDAFACNNRVAGKRVALIDDVMTTGTSLDELAKSLIQAGALEVEAWVVARTLPPAEQTR